MHEIYQDGNRLAVPLDIKSDHFLYHVDAPAFADLDKFALAAHEHLGSKRLKCAQIDAFLVHGKDGVKYGLNSPFASIVQQLGLDEDEVHTAQVVYCEWASIHEDIQFAGKVHLSVVAHTGPQPYIMQMAHTGIRMSSLGHRNIAMPTSICQLDVGDTILFDPTTPHMAMPKRPEDAQMLVLLQFEIKDPDDASRARLIERFRPKDGVITGRSVFSDESSDPPR